MKKWSLLFSFVLVAFYSLSLFAQVDPDPERFAKEISEFQSWDAKNSLPDNYVLFVGSSSIRLWKTAEAFPQYKIVNRGFGGAHISDMLVYLEDIALKYPAPKCIVFYCGDNDITGKKDPDRVLTDYQKFVARIHNRFTETPIVYIPAKPSRARWNLWDNMSQLNEKVKTYSESSPLLYYADTATPMLNGTEQPTADLFIQDGLHLSEKGYAMWNEVVNRVFVQIFQTGKK